MLATNPHKGDVTFEVEGKMYTLRFSHYALVKLEETLDRSLMQVMTEMARPDRLRIGTVLALLWAGLQKHHPKMTREEAASLLDNFPEGMPGVMKIIDDAFGKAFASTLGTKGTDPTQKEENGIGMSSSLSSSLTDMPQTSSGNSRRDN